MSRYRYGRQAVMALIVTSVLIGCMAPPPRAGTTQSAPNQSHSLAAKNSVITPYSASPANGSPGADSGSDELLANQTVVKVGLLLPLSGRNAGLGKALQDAAAVSLFDKYARLSPKAQNVRVELIPADTGDTAERAAMAMHQAVDAGVSFVIGPLFADATAAGAPIARAKNLSVLSLSNTRTQASPGTYMFGFSPSEQADRVITYAMQNNKTKLAVLVPNSAFGETILTAARASVERNGGKLVVEAKYLTAGAGIDSALNTLVKGKAPAFDAILIPEGGLALDTIVRGLASRGVRPSNVQFLGTGLWDDPDLLRRVNLDGAWFASSPPDLNNEFTNRFKSTYNYDPPRIASLAYDAVALAVTLATSNRPFDATTLTSSAGYAGPANGLFRLRADGTTERGLAVMQVKGASASVVSNAPKMF